MSRLIDADAIDWSIVEDEYGKRTDSIVACEILIENQTTIDAVRVVRCKDCKHNPKYTNDYMYGGCVFCCEDDFYSGTPDDDFFCGFGERKGE